MDFRGRPLCWLLRETCCAELECHMGSNNPLRLLPGRYVLAALCCGLLPVMAQDHRDRLLSEANAAYRSLRAADAVRLFREYLALYPDRADVRVFLGAALLNLDQFQAALDEANRACYTCDTC